MMALSPSTQDRTIVALASAAGRAGVAVLRLSGPQAMAVVRKVCRPDALPAPRCAALRDIVDFRSGEILDHALVLCFPAPHSFTGEDVVELHIHGGRALLKVVLETLCAVPGVTLAEAGEFSRRAFENGKMDLTEAEALADLIDAETTAQRRQALRQMDGELGRLYEGWAERLKKALAFIEAEIDFADEDIPAEIAQDRLKDTLLLEKEMATHLDDQHRGERLREGFMVALLGAPNAGKSSLLNALSRREAAIVDPTPGTTRDIIEVQLDLGGYPIALADTAGLRETADHIESEGVRRALARAEQADIKMLVFDGTLPLAQQEATLALRDAGAVIVVNKMDAVDVPDAVRNTFVGEERVFYLSAKTGEGLKALTEGLVEEIDKRFVGTAQPALTRLRHRHALESSLAHIRRAIAADQTELCAEDLRLAMRDLGRITGRVDVEDVLDVIFSSFCIGK